MSGQQLGTAVGFVAGFFLPGGPQVWAAVGGMIGGAIDPTKIEGPHIGDGRQQSSNEGEPISWVLGTAGWLQGNLVQVSAVREIKKEDDGKGSGQVFVTYEARQDYCIMAAESSETRNSTIVGVLMVRQNGQIVYDMRAASNFGAENAKFLQNHVFYYGHEDQMPNPTMEAISGVGNTPAYRGVFTMIGFDVDLTPFGNAIPTYEFVLVGSGEAVTTEITELLSPGYAQFGNSGDPLVDPDSHYGLQVFRTTADGSDIGPLDVDSVSEGSSVADEAGYSAGPLPPNIFVGFMPLSLPEDPRLSKFVVGGFDITDDVRTVVVYQDRNWVTEIDYRITDGFDLASHIPNDGQYHLGNDGWLYILADTDDLPYHYPVPGTAPFPIRVWAIAPMLVYAERHRFFDPPTPLPDAPGWYVDENGEVKPIPTYVDTPGSYKVLQAEVKVPSDNILTMEFEQYEMGPVLLDTDPNNTQAFWEAAAAAAGVTGTYGVDFPQDAPSALIGTSSTTSLTTSPITVATAIARIAGRGDLQPTDINTSDIIDTLEGYPIQADYNGADCIGPLLAYVAGFAAEYDGKIHFHLYGGPIEITVDPLDFIEGSEETDTDTREQAKEYPRKISVSYVDIDQNYTVRPQSSYRISPDVRAISEESVQLPLCAHADRASKMADISMKVSWARQQGTRKFSVPWVGYSPYLQLVPGMPFALDGRRWICNRVILDDGILGIEAAYDRQSAYTSIATGVPAPPPTPPKSTLNGATIMAVMNIPALRDQDDRLGLYVAVTGVLTSWPGCSLQMSSDGQATWTTVISSMTQASTMGNLLTPLADASFAGDDVTNVLKVFVRGGELNSITEELYLNEANPSALVRNDGTAEIIQFRDADELDSGRYDLSFLSRGRLGTETTSHPTGEQFVFLDSVYFLELAAGLIGRTLYFRAVTFGTTPDATPVYSILFLPAMSQMELAPEFLTSSRVGDTLTLSVVPRHRFGTPVNPIQSSNLLAYHFYATDGTNFADFTVGTPSTPISVAGWSSPIQVTVTAVNRFTGDGFPLIEEIEI